MNWRFLRKVSEPNKKDFRITLDGLFSNVLQKKKKRIILIKKIRTYVHEYT